MLILGGNDAGQNPFDRNTTTYKSNKIYEYNLSKQELSLLTTRLPIHCHLKRRTVCVTLKQSIISQLLTYYQTLYSIPLVIATMIHKYIDDVELLHVLDEDNAHWIINIQKL